MIHPTAVVDPCARLMPGVSVGAHSLCAFGSHVRKDVPPFVVVAGQPAEPHGLNTEGMRRRKVPQDTIAALRHAYKVLYRDGLTLEDARGQLAELAAATPDVARFLEFLRGESRHGIVR